MFKLFRGVSLMYERGVVSSGALAEHDSEGSTGVPNARTFRRQRARFCVRALRRGETLPDSLSMRTAMTGCSPRALRDAVSLIEGNVSAPFADDWSRFGSIAGL